MLPMYTKARLLVEKNKKQKNKIIRPPASSENLHKHLSTTNNPDQAIHPNHPPYIW